MHNGLSNLIALSRLLFTISWTLKLSRMMTYEIGWMVRLIPTFSFFILHLLDYMS